MLRDIQVTAADLGTHIAALQRLGYAASSPERKSCLQIFCRTFDAGAIASLPLVDRPELNLSSATRRTLRPLAGPIDDAHNMLSPEVEQCPPQDIKDDNHLEDELLGDSDAN